MRFFALLIASFYLSLFMDSSTAALMCYNNTDFTENTEWNIQRCDTTSNEISCLAQFRLYNDQLLPSFFGCHTTEIPCDPTCNPIEGQGNDFSCCCSSDFCNEFPNWHYPDYTNLCEYAGCSQNCMELNGVAECYCDYGYTLDVDGITCIDINECLHNNGGCEGTCHNEIGTGYHCSCPTHQLLKDGFLCEDFTDPVCYSQRCNATGCVSEYPVASQCDTSHPRSHVHCQATYKEDKGSYSVRLLSCFSGSFTCEQGGCTLREIGAGTSIYYCCCDGPFCNGNITFPSDP